MSFRSLEEKLKQLEFEIGQEDKCPDSDLAEFHRISEAVKAVINDMQARVAGAKLG